MADKKNRNFSNVPIAIPDVVDAPTIGTATAGIQSATVPFTAASTGGRATSFTAISTPGSITGSSTTSPITVSGLTAGTAYTFKVYGSNPSGTWSSLQSAASNSVGAATVSSLTFNAGGTQFTNDNSQTVANLSIGTADINRYVVIALRTRNPLESENALPASVTVAGQSCSLVVFVNVTGGTTAIGRAIYITDAPVTTGTTANVVVTAPVGETLTSTFVSSYSLITFGSTPNLIYTDFKVAAASTAGYSINSPWKSGYFGIVAGTASTNIGLSGFTMSGSGIVTQDYSSGITEFGALITGTLIGEGDITFTTTGSASLAGMVMAIWV